MKKSGCIGLALWIAGLAITAVAESPEVPDPKFDVGVETSFTTGESSWRISFVEFIPGTGLLAGSSKLAWEEMDAAMLRFHGTYRITPRFRASISYGQGDISGGKNTDTDWFSLEQPNDYIFSESIADSDGRIRYIDAQLALRLNEIRDMSRIGGVWDISAGYLFYQEDLRLRNGIQTILFEEAMNEPFDGLNSKFLFEWHAFRLGLNVEVPLARRFRVKAGAAGLVGVDFRGEGYWNLRTDFRDESPNFVQRASGGYGAEFRMSGVFDFNEALYAEFGMWSITMRARNGTDKTYFADGAVGTTTLDNVESTRSGFFVGVGGRF